MPLDQKSLLIWDVFKAHSTIKVQDTFAGYGIETAMVPKNVACLLQLLDLTTTNTLKKVEQKYFEALPTKISSLQ